MRSVILVFLTLFIAGTCFAGELPDVPQEFVQPGKKTVIFETNPVITGENPNEKNILQSGEKSFTDDELENEVRLKLERMTSGVSKRQDAAFGDLAGETSIIAPKTGMDDLEVFPSKRRGR